MSPSRLRLTKLLIIFAVLLVTEQQAEAVQPVNRLQTSLFYATDRNQVPGSQRWGDQSSDERFGVLTICITDSSSTVSRTPPNWWDQDRVHSVQDDHFRIHEDDRIPAQSFYDRINARLDELSSLDPNRPRTVFLFVHGFDNSFYDAAERTAQFTRDIGVRGAAIFYSWPSQNHLWAYTWDATYAERSTPMLRDLIAGLLTHVRMGRLEVIAHSMGNRITLQALRELSWSRPDLASRVNALVLLAPDVDTISFERTTLDRLPQMAAHTTIFVNRSDKALAVSARVNGGIRLGTYDIAPLTSRNFLTIDTTGVGGFFSSHHSDFDTVPSYMREIGADLADRPIGSRRCLSAVSVAGGVSYYQLRPDLPACRAIRGDYPPF